MPPTLFCTGTPTPYSTVYSTVPADRAYLSGNRSLCMHSVLRQHVTCCFQGILDFFNISFCSQHLFCLSFVIRPYHPLLYVLPACLYILPMHEIVIINSSHFLASLRCQFVLHPMRSTSLSFYILSHLFWQDNVRYSYCSGT
jgi:hypothetical protein